MINPIKIVSVSSLSSFSFSESKMSDSRPHRIPTKTIDFPPNYYFLFYYKCNNSFEYYPHFTPKFPPGFKDEQKLSLVKREMIVMKNGEAIYIMQDDKSRVIPVARFLNAELYKKKTTDQIDITRAALEKIIIENPLLDDEDVHGSQQRETAFENQNEEEELENRMQLATKKSKDAGLLQLEDIDLEELGKGDPNQVCPKCLDFTEAFKERKVIL